MPVRPRSLLLAGVAFALGVAALYVATRSLAPVALLDGRAAEGLESLEGSLAGEDALRVATKTVDPAPFVVLLVALGAYGVAVGRAGWTAATAAVAVGANVTTQLLKVDSAEAWLAARVAVDAELPGFPSGHATAAMSLAVGAVLVARPGRRLLVAAGGGLFAVVQAVAMLVLEWHRPSDVVAAYGVVAAWACFVVAGLLAVRRWRGHVPDAYRGPRATLRAAALPVALLGLVALVTVGAVAGPDGALEYVGEHTTGALGGAVVAASAVAVPMVLAAVLPERAGRVR